MEIITPPELQNHLYPIYIYMRPFVSAAATKIHTFTYSCVTASAQSYFFWEVWCHPVRGKYLWICQWGWGVGGGCTVPHTNNSHCTYTVLLPLHRLSKSRCCLPVKAVKAAGGGFMEMGDEDKHWDIKAPTKSMPDDNKQLHMWFMHTQTHTVTI